MGTSSINQPRIIVESPDGLGVGQDRQQAIVDWLRDPKGTVMFLPDGCKAYQFVDGKWAGLDAIVSVTNESTSPPKEVHKDQRLVDLCARRGELSLQIADLQLKLLEARAEDNRLSEEQEKVFKEYGF